VCVLSSLRHARAENIKVPKNCHIHAHIAARRLICKTFDYPIGPATCGFFGERPPKQFEGNQLELKKFWSGEEKG
jgi:hypothetical protein